MEPTENARLDVVNDGFRALTIKRELREFENISSI